jgi:hypothetical protein
MKRYICILSGLLFFYGAHSQQNGNSASNMNSYLNQFVGVFERQNDVVVHAETGIMTINTSQAGDYTTRKLYKGNTYVIEAYTDLKINDFRLMIWEKDSKGNWQKYDSVNKNNHVSLKLDSIGDMEAIKVIPDEDNDFAIQLLSQSYTNRTGRYGVLILRKDDSKTDKGSSGSSGGSSGSAKSDTKTYFSSDYYSIAYYKKDANGNMQRQGDWVRTNGSNLFMRNADESYFEQTGAGGKKAYFVQGKTNKDSDYTYEIKDDEGNTLSIEVDVTKDEVNVYGKADSDRWYSKVYHIIKIWNE